MQGVLQGFRVVGTGTKLGKDYPVVAYRYGGAVELEKLLDYIPDSNGEQQQRHFESTEKKRYNAKGKPAACGRTGVSRTKAC